MTRLPIGYAGWELRDMARGPGAIILAIAASSSPAFPVRPPPMREPC